MIYPKDSQVGQVGQVRQVRRELVLAPLLPVALIEIQPLPKAFPRPCSPSTLSHAVLPATSVIMATTPHWTEPQQDDQDEEQYTTEETDSALGNDVASSTASLSASLLEYRTLHGRTYHSLQGSAEHWTPNDNTHLESMDCAHHCLTLLLKGKLYLAPIAEGPIKVLDVGCGTGIWAIDFADAHPNATVIGTDISPSQPEWVPPNLKFEIEDCTQPWTYPPNIFDFVHLRYLFGSISDWESLYEEAFKACKPGGWVEALEPSVNIKSDDGSVREGTALYDWGRLFNEASAKAGRSMSIVDDGTVSKAFRKAGFVNITSRPFKLPATSWPLDKELKEVGAFSQLTMEQDLDGYAMLLFTQALGWTHAEVTIYLARIRKEMRDMRFKPYFLVEVVYGRKPE
ncbi:S-adenosyl-L-methionine-dependent methyltransferase [Xylaria sp. CBS 124048]|nr:S-adenosyl-L-methionine-dependent methyltransferase [Xylaria sp. CBS 124048]